MRRQCPGQDQGGGGSQHQAPRGWRHGATGEDHHDHHHSLRAERGGELLHYQVIKSLTNCPHSCRIING